MKCAGLNILPRPLSDTLNVRLCDINECLVSGSADLAVETAANPSHCT